MSHHHHAIDYVEIAAPELATARDFYASAFGWQFNDYGPEYAGIKGPDPDGPEAGGLAANGPASPLVILYSDDLDGSVQAVTAAGGEIVNGPYEFPGGRRFHFTDPCGNELAVWSAS
jgi:predicted enzyme related to lactoylglutathione lyase